MRKLITISPTEANGKKLESWQDFLAGGYYAFGWYQTDFSGWSLDEIINDIKEQRFKDDDNENQKEIDKAIKAHSSFNQINIGDVIVPVNNRYGLFGIGIIKSEYKFKKRLHLSRVTGPNEVEFYSHYRDVDWIFSDYLKTEDINFESANLWKPYGTINIREEIPMYISRLLSNRGFDLSLMPIDWEKKVTQWFNKRKTIKIYENDTIEFFENIIRNTYYPEKAFWGSNKHAIKAMIGHLYLGAYIHTGNDKGISLIVDKELSIGEGISFHPVKSTLASTSKFQLFWLWIADLSNLSKILNNQSVWHSFKRASKKIIDTPQGKYIRESEKLGKARLDMLAVRDRIILSESEYQQKLQDSINNGKKLSKEERNLESQKLPIIPEKVIIQSTAFKRNQFVVIETIERANGKCELCCKDAPFVKIKDKTPFLEVHHVNPLANGGEDTLNNTVALCPNCHREAHLGINKDKIKKKLFRVLKKYSL